MPMDSQKVCKVTSYVGSNADEFPVIAVNFNSGPIEKEEARNVECDLYCDARNNSKKTLSLKRKTQSYKGDVPLSSESICNRLLLVVRRNTNEAKLVPFTSCQMTNVSYSKRAKSDEQAVDYDESRSRLAHAFGSKASKKAYEVSARIRATTAVSDGTKLEQTIIEKKLPLDTLASDINVETSMVEQLLPPCNRQANNLTDIYPLNGILSERELTDLEPAAEILLNQPPDETNADFLLQPFLKSISSNKTLLKTQLLLYANSLIIFTGLTKYELKKKEKLALISPHSKMIETKILKHFSTFSENMRVRTPEQRDSAVCYAMVAILLACNYSVHLDWLCSSLRGYRPKQLQTLAKLVGVVPGANRKIHLLKLPLPPIPTGARMARK